jgi:hypothetical protein
VQFPGDTFFMIRNPDNYTRYLEALVISLLDERNVNKVAPVDEEDVVSTDRENPPTTDTTFAPMLVRQEIREQREARSILSADVTGRLTALKGQYEQLEAQESKVGQSIIDLIRPHMDTVSGCESLLDLVPAGYCSFVVRRALADLQNPK